MCVWCDVCGRCYVWQALYTVCVVCEGNVSSMYEYVWRMSVCVGCRCLCVCGTMHVIGVVCVVCECMCTV